MAHYDSLGYRTRDISGGLETVATFDSMGNRLSLTYPGGRVLTYNGGAYDDFYGFVLRGGVSAADSSVAFRNVSAKFFQTVDGITRVQTGITDDAVATTVGSSQPDAEEILVTVPEGGGFRSAKLFAQVRMQSPDLPNPSDLFGQIFIYAAPHS